MPALRELQQAIVAAVLEDASPGTLGLLVGTPSQAQVGLLIYRNNASAGFARALALQFPVIERLVGDDYFRQLARSYQQQHPSTSGDLGQIGTDFALFLRRTFADTEYAYLPDVAELEWHRETLSTAEPAPALPIQALTEISPEHYERVQLRLQAASRLSSSPYPILQIWRVNQQDGATDTLIDLNAGAEHVLARQTSDGLQLLPLDAGQFALLAALARGDTLGVALQTALDVDARFDLGQALALAFMHGVFTHLDLHP